MLRWLDPPGDAAQSVDLDAVTEQDVRWDARSVELSENDAVTVDVHLCDAHVLAESAGQTLEGRQLPDAEEAIRTPRALEEPDTVQLLAAVFDQDTDVIAAALGRMLETTSKTFGHTLDSYGSELIELAMQEPEAFERSFEEASGRAARVALSSKASMRLKSLMQ